MKRLNQPMPARVRLDENNVPAEIWWSSGASRRGSGSPGDRHAEVTGIVDELAGDDFWWTSEPVRRIYRECRAESGAVLVLIHDLQGECWYVQRVC